MTIEKKLETLEKARKEGATESQIERLCNALWPSGDIPEDVEKIKTIAVVPDNKELQKIVCNIFKELGIPAHILGYKYLRSAIILCIDDAEMLTSITKRLYPTIAAEHGTTSSKVERAIRHAIEVTCDRGNVAAMQQYFGYAMDCQKGKPTNHEFVASLVNQIELQYM